MTTLITFVPSTSGAPQFQATLDGALYTIICTWNLSGQRYYINVYSQDGTLIVCKAMIGSPPAPDPGINLLFGYFVTSTLVYRTANSQFEIGP